MLVLQRQRRDQLRQGEDHMEVLDRQQLRSAFVGRFAVRKQRYEPSFRLPACWSGLDLMGWTAPRSITASMGHDGRHASWA